MVQCCDCNNGHGVGSKSIMSLNVLIKVVVVVVVEEDERQDDNSTATSKKEWARKGGIARS